MASSICFYMICGLSIIRGAIKAALSEQPPAPIVKTLNGTFLGMHSSFYDQDYFLGIPYAQPPVGPLRFSPPVPLNTSWEGTRTATEYGHICYSYGDDATRLNNLGYSNSEDCLTLNVIRPSTASHSTHELLPVGVYIHGGGYYMGGSPDPRQNLSYIVESSTDAGVPIMAVSINYRLGAFGFLGGSEMIRAGAANLGFRDQRLALRWIQENIEAFGGDPSKVTIWGNSAGAGSVGAQLLAYNGRDDGLFRGAISESGSPVGFLPLTPTLPTDEWDEIYNGLADGAGCTRSNTKNTLQCLRNAPLDILGPLVNSITATSDSMYITVVIDNDFIVDLPARQLARGDFVKVPYLIGSNTDEGTSWVPHDSGWPYEGAPTYKMNTTADFLERIMGTLPINSTVAESIATLYPPDAADQVVATYPNDLPDKLGAQYKRLVTFTTDYIIVAPTRFAVQSWANYGVPVFQYRWNAIVSGMPRYVGAPHAAAIAFVLKDFKGWDYPIDPFLDKPKSYRDLAGIMSTAFATFIATGDPNLRAGGVNGTRWPQYTNESQQNFVFDANVTSYVEEDTWRRRGTDYLQSFFLEG